MPFYRAYPQTKKYVSLTPHPTGNQQPATATASEGAGIKHTSTAKHLDAKIFDQGSSLLWNF